MIKINKAFLIGNQRGQVSAHNIIGEVDQQLDCMGNEISNLKLDSFNKLFVVTSECNLYIQSLEKVKVSEHLKSLNKPYTLRQIKNLHGQKVITCVELSVYHSLIFTGSSSIYFFLFKINTYQPLITNWENYWVASLFHRTMNQHRFNVLMDIRYSQWPPVRDS